MSLKERWLYTLDISAIHSLAQFNGLLKDYMRTYNTTFHTGIQATPMERYHKLFCIRELRVCPAGTSSRSVFIS